MPKLTQRLAELEAQMTGEKFWNHQEAAQKVINETNDIRGKLDPLARFGKQLEDVSEKEFADIAGEVGLQQAKPKRH